MQKIFIIFFICSFYSVRVIYSQPKSPDKEKYLLSFGMGIDYSSNTSYTDYLRQLLSTNSTDTVKTFSTGVEFFGGIEYRLSKGVSVKLDYSYYIRSNRYIFLYYNYEYTVTSHQPYIMAFYRLQSNKINLKLGAGAGYHLYMLEDKFSSSGSIDYKASGLSFRGEIIFAPKFSKSLETYLSGFVFGSTSSSLKNGNGNLLKNTAGEEVNLGGYGVGARLGLSIYLN